MPRRIFRLIFIPTLFLLFSHAHAEQLLTQEQLALQISELAQGKDETASDIQLGYSGIFGTVHVSLEIVGCNAIIQQYSHITDEQILVDFRAEFDLNDVRLLRGRNYSNSVVNVQGLSESAETEEYYTYSTTANSDRIVANVTFKRNDGANFEYEGVDYFALRSPVKIDPDNIEWVPLQSSEMVLIILNPKDEKQLQLLVSSIDEYRLRFCLAIS